MTSSSFPGSETKAQPETVALFASDLHLQSGMPRTAQAFLDFIHMHARRTQQLYLLGDIFEAWAGDDDLEDAFNRHIVEALNALHQGGVAIYWIAGNRDFLAGERFSAESGAVLLPDPTIVVISGKPLVLTHGDAYCTDDQAYMHFRAQVRDESWQRQFLSLPLSERKAIIASLRAGSREAQRGKSYDIMDVNPGAIAELFEKSAVTTMIHGHTHRPARHEARCGGSALVRYVLSDWDLDHGQPRGDWLAMDGNGKLHRMSVGLLHAG
jgi:UDP-2,3-diacylglucosamine hydrolase